eukprot:3659379-Pleurochrysis_carterae.AAC.5
MTGYPSPTLCTRPCTMACRFSRSLSTSLPTYTTRTFNAKSISTRQRGIECIRDSLLTDNCTGQDFADKVNTLIRDHNLYIQVPYVGERLWRLIIKFLLAALAGKGKALLRELIDNKQVGNESRVMEGHHAARQDGASPSSGFGGAKYFQHQEGQEGNHRSCDNSNERPDGRGRRRRTWWQTAVRAA